MNRSTIFEFLRNDTDLELRYTKIGKGSYPVMRIPYKWEHSFLQINDIRITDFQAIMLFSKDLVVRFDIYNDYQVNIPYSLIEYIEVTSDENFEIGYMALHKGNKIER